jgi:hypothetical protein
VRGQRPGQLTHLAGTEPGVDPVVAGHREHVPDTAVAQRRPQARVVAVHLVGGHPGRWGAGVQGATDHLGGQLRLGLERRPRRNPRGRAAGLVLGPRPGQIQRTVDERVSGLGGVGQVDGDLRVLDAPGGAGVLALHPDRGGALLQIAGLIQHQHRARVAQPLDHVAA